MNKKQIFIAIALLLCGGEVLAGELINKHLPKWLNVDLEYRYRFELQDNFDFNESVDDDDEFNLYRLRLTTTLKPINHVKIVHQFQDSRISNRDGRFASAVFENWADTRLLFVQLDDLAKCEKISLTGLGFKLGRQDFNYGSQRLLGPVNWSNIGQSFDAGKIMLKYGENFTIDGFGGALTNNKVPREYDDMFDGSSKDILGGYYATYKGIKDVTIEQYLLNRKTNKNITYRSGTTGELDIYTFGARVAGKVTDTPWDYELEAATQWGDHNNLEVNAQMAVAVLGYTFKHDWKPRLALEFDYASGDKNSSDSEQNTFDNLYPTNHIHYGFMDRASLQNLNNYRAQVKIQPHKKVTLQSDLHFIFVDTPRDSLFAANRSAIATPTGNGTGKTHVGNELDLLAKFKVCDYADLLMGYSHLWAGDYLHESGKDDDANYFYTEATFSF